MKSLVVISIIIALCTNQVIARTCNLEKKWLSLCPVLEARTTQVIPKMKLQESAAESLEIFLRKTQDRFYAVARLQTSMPKTTVELLMAVKNRGVSEKQANLMAQYLSELINKYHFQNLPAFDNNTSHIIGRRWPEIDYAGEGMTWRKQKQKYAPYGISDFKSVQNLKKFFPVESKLPYFNKVYKPKIATRLK